MWFCGWLYVGCYDGFCVVVVNFVYGFFVGGVLWWVCVWFVDCVLFYYWCVCYDCFCCVCDLVGGYCCWWMILICFVFGFSVDVDFWCV